MSPKNKCTQTQNPDIPKNSLTKELSKYPSLTDQIPGLSLALFSKDFKVKSFWWLIFLSCTGCGMLTIVSVVTEYIKHNTATLISVKLVPSFELPAITICPKEPDALNYDPLLKNIQTRLPQITNETALNLVSYWLAGSGISSIEPAFSFSDKEINELDEMFKIWSSGYDTKTFFHKIQDEFGYKCEQLFQYCEINVKAMNCCTEMFKPIWVLKQGLCYQTRQGINQTIPDDIGWFSVFLKAPPSITSRKFNRKPQLIVYVNDNFEHVMHYPRYYLNPFEDNTLHLNAKLVELQESEGDCVNKVVGKNAACYVDKWLTSHLIGPFNCTVPYYTLSDNSTAIKICDPLTIVKNYEMAINGAKIYEKRCVPGCKKWEYERSFLVRGSEQKDEQNPYFQLAVGFDELQYQRVKEISTISPAGLLSQIGGQLGLYLGLSIVTILQIFIYFVTKIGHFFYRVFKY